LEPDWKRRERSHTRCRHKIPALCFLVARETLGRNALQPGNIHIFSRPNRAAISDASGQQFTLTRFWGRGGKTNVWGRVSLRYSGLDFRAALRDGNDIPWPIRYQDIAPYDDRVLPFQRCHAHFPGSAIHKCGTCRMGDDPKRLALNGFCQSREVKNLFVVDAAAFTAATEKNPTLTILALAWRATDYLAEELRIGRL
jgi:choline dehydrogenase-like flavoprotein